MKTYRDFITEGVAENDIVKFGGILSKVDSVTDATNLIIKTALGADITPAEAYEVYNSAFLNQFSYTKQGD